MRQTLKRIQPDRRRLEAPELSGFLRGLRAGGLESWGLLEVLSLVPASREVSDRTELSGFVAPLENLKLIRVPNYGTMVLRNVASKGALVLPMHVGFFQRGAQNHATSRVLVIDAGETVEVSDCYCIQEAQGGYLEAAQQRFVMLPLSLRRPAFEKRREEDFARLWGDIADFTGKYGATGGGHLERFLRPYFGRLQRYRHAFESTPDQVGAAYFVAGELVGVEVAPNGANWTDVAPIFGMFCYGPAAVRAEHCQRTSARTSIDLEQLENLDDLAERLESARSGDFSDRATRVRELCDGGWEATQDETRLDLDILTVARDEWRGQVVRRGPDTVYASVFRDLPFGKSTKT